MAIQYETSEYKNLSQETKAALDVSAKREFGHVPIVKNHVWAAPDWCIFAMEAKRRVASVCLIVRKGTFDEKEVLILGVNNLITEPDERRKGLGRSLMERAIKLCFDRFDANAVVLFCADGLVEYYESFGFKKVACPVWIAQPEGRKTWESNCLVNSRIGLPTDKIDLCGLPW
jgi:predicted N-acetyltransferase YhbS